MNVLHRISLDHLHWRLWRVPPFGWWSHKAVFSPKHFWQVKLENLNTTPVPAF
jgi:hypothetical protein